MTMLSPGSLVKELESGKLSLLETVAATEMLGHVRPLELAYGSLLRQLENSDALVKEASMVALRVIFVGQPDIKLPLNIRQKLETLSRTDVRPSVRLLALEALGDLPFEEKSSE